MNVSDRYPNVSEAYEANFRVFRAEPANSPYFNCKKCWSQEHEHIGSKKMCSVFTPERFTLASVEEDLEWRNKVFNPSARC